MTLDRRGFLAACSRAGIASPLLPGILYALTSQAQEAAGADQSKPTTITPEMIDQAAVLAGVGPFTAEQKQMMHDALIDNNGSYKAIRKLNLPNSIPPAYVFHPYSPVGTVTAKAHPEVERPASREWEPDPEAAAPARADDLAFATVNELASLLRSRKVTSLA